MNDKGNRGELPIGSEVQQSPYQRQRQDAHPGFEDNAGTPARWSEQGERAASIAQSGSDRHGNQQDSVVTPGARQEQQVRDELTSRGYEQRFGSTDDEIRRNLGVGGACADFVGHHKEKGDWIVAESKGGDLLRAEIQLKNTNEALKTRAPEAAGNTKYEIHMNAQQYDRLRQNDGHIGGYFMRDGHLGAEDDRGKFCYREIDDTKIAIRRVEEHAKIGDDDE